jgi:hypothetical protein
MSDQLGQITGTEGRGLALPESCGLFPLRVLQPDRGNPPAEQSRRQLAVLGAGPSGFASVVTILPLQYITLVFRAQYLIRW